MLTVDKIALIRRAYFGDGKGIKAIAKELGIGVGTVQRIDRVTRQAA